MSAGSFLTAMGVANALLLVIGCAGCGSTTGNPGGPASADGASHYAELVPQTVPSMAPSNDPNNMANNPFVLWVKANYPQQAAQIITKYLAQTPGAADDPSRDQLRAQVLAEVAQQLQINVQKGVPQGFKAVVAGHNVQVSGIDDYQGHNIYVRFEFWTQFLPDGDVQISQPPTTTYAEAQDLLAQWFGGDVTAQAQAQITAALDEAGPQNAAPHFPGLSYLKGGTFIVDPGVCFVNMPAST